MAEDGNFARTAAMLAASQSALSHTVCKSETRLGPRLLAHATRSIAATELGELSKQ